jgi:hypothetical protein
VLFRVSSPSDTRVRSVTADLIGDGEPGWTIATDNDARQIAGLFYTGTKRGVFNLVISAIDADGCAGTTGLRRDVTVN